MIDETPGAAGLRVQRRDPGHQRRRRGQGHPAELGDKGDARARLAKSGLVLSRGEQPTITSVRPGSEAARLRLRPGDKIEGVSVPNERPSPFLFALPALALLLAIAMAQRRRAPRGRPADATQGAH